MIEHSENIATIAAALLAAQAEMGGAKRDAKNPHFKSSYATLETVIETAKPALQAHGIAFMQAPGQLIDGALEVTTMLVHGESGQWMRSTLHVPLQKRDPQGVGSAITYACRYSLMAMLGIPPTDDDGEGAMDRSGSAKQEPAKKSVSAAEMKRGLEAIDNDLTDCHTVADVNRCAKIWAELMDRDRWSKDYRDIAIPKFAARRSELTLNDEIPDFPGDRPSGEVANVMAG